MLASRPQSQARRQQRRSDVVHSGRGAAIAVPRPPIITDRLFPGPVRKVRCPAAPYRQQAAWPARLPSSSQNIPNGWFAETLSVTIAPGTQGKTAREKREPSDVVASLGIEPRTRGFSRSSLILTTSLSILQMFSRLMLGRKLACRRTSLCVFQPPVSCTESSGKPCYINRMA